MSARDQLGPLSCHCVTCADEGVPMRVLAVERGAGLARCVREGGEGDATAVESAVETALVEPVDEGDVLLVHAGVALLRLGEPAVQEARA